MKPNDLNDLYDRPQQPIHIEPSAAVKQLIARIDALSRDSAAPSHRAIAAALHDNDSHQDISEAINRLLRDENWSQDREPYQWLTELAATCGVVTEIK